MCISALNNVGASSVHLVETQKKYFVDHAVLECYCSDGTSLGSSTLIFSVVCFPCVVWFPAVFEPRSNFPIEGPQTSFKPQGCGNHPTPSHNCSNQMACSPFLSRSKYSFEDSCSEFNLAFCHKVLRHDGVLWFSWPALDRCSSRMLIFLGGGLFANIMMQNGSMEFQNCSSETNGTETKFPKTSWPMLAEPTRGWFQMQVPLKFFDFYVHLELLAVWSFTDFPSTDAVVLKCLCSSLPCILFWYKFAFLRKHSPSQIFPDLPRSSPLRLTAMRSFRRDALGGLGGGLYVSELTQNGAIEFKKCSSKENGLEPQRISTVMPKYVRIARPFYAKIRQMRSTFNEIWLCRCLLLYPSLPLQQFSLSVLGALRCFSMSARHVSVHASLICQFLCLYQY